MIDVINTMNTNIESCTNHFVQKAMSEVIPDEHGVRAGHRGRTAPTP